MTREIVGPVFVSSGLAWVTSSVITSGQDPQWRINVDGTNTSGAPKRATHCVVDNLDGSSIVTVTSGTYMVRVPPYNRMTIELVSGASFVQFDLIQSSPMITLSDRDLGIPDVANEFGLVIASTPGAAAGQNNIFTLNEFIIPFQTSGALNPALGTYSPSRTFASASTWANTLFEAASPVAGDYNGGEAILGGLWGMYEFDGVSYVQLMNGTWRGVYSSSQNATEFTYTGGVGAGQVARAGTISIGIAATVDSAVIGLINSLPFSAGATRS